jgi:hypothetical protein
MKRTLLLIGLFSALCWLPATRGFSDTSVSINIGAPVAPYHYWYYPEWGVYYDYDAHMYFYMEGGAWVRVHRLPPRFHHLGHRVRVEGERGKPWSHYDAHRAKYPPGHMKQDNWEHGKGHDKHNDHDRDHDKHDRDHDRH